MARDVALYSAQWGDLPLDKLCEMAADFGFDGLELAANDKHLDLSKLSEEYCDQIQMIMAKYGLKVYAVSNHTVGQCLCDNIDIRHKAIVPSYVWGDGEPSGVRARAAEEMIRNGRAAKMLGVDTVIGFTGSPIWQYLYSFPPVAASMIEDGYAKFAELMKPVLDAYQEMGVRFALEVHPAEIAFDITSARRALKALDYHPAFGFNYDPSHMGYQGVDYVKFIHEFKDRIFHVHMKDVWWSDRPTDTGVFGGHSNFGDMGRFWDFRSLGRGSIDFEEIIRALNRIGYNGVLSVEWEDSGMDRERGAWESCEYVRSIDFEPSAVAFDAAFETNK